MAINLDELKPILEMLLTDREDAADVIESITTLDKPASELTQADVDAAVAAANADWNSRYMKQFFQPTQEVPAPVADDTAAEPAGDNDGEDLSPLSFDDILTPDKEN